MIVKDFEYLLLDTPRPGFQIADFSELSESANQHHFENPFDLGGLRFTLFK